MSRTSVSPTIGRRSALGVGLASVYSAAVAYLVLLIAAQVLDRAENAVFLAYWSVLFGGFGVVTGVSPEAARSAYDGQRADRPDTGVSGGRPPGGEGARIIGTGLAYGASVAVVVAATAPLWGPAVLGQWWWLVLVAALACLAYAGHLALWGVLTGLQRWRGVAGLAAGESTVRLAAVLVALAVWRSLPALAVASAVSAGAWTLTLVSGRIRAHLRRRSDVRPGRLWRNYASASAASAASAALMVGFPVLISLTSARPEFLASAGLMLGISLTRAPLLVPLTAYQGVALTYFLRHRDRGLRALLPVVGVITGVSVLAALAAALVGPWVYGLLLGGRYRLSGSVLAGLVLAAGLLAVLTITGMCCLALRRHRAYALGWICSSVAAVLVLLGPGVLQTRVLTSLLVAPTVGIVVHLVALRGGEHHPPSSTPAAPRPQVTDLVGPPAHRSRARASDQ